MKIFLFIFLSLSLFARQIDVTYQVSFGIFGSVGEANAHLISNKSRYKIVVKAKAMGLAKVFSGGRVEEYRSEGVVEDGLLKPLLFQKMRKSHKKIVKKIYHFFHDKRVVKVRKEIYKKGKLEEKSEEKLPFYAKEDILTLYFNIQKYLKPSKYSYKFYAVGGRKKDGFIEVQQLRGEKLKKIKKLMKENGLYLAVILHQKIFASQKGELFLVLDKNGITKKALLKDVILFGDVKGELKSYKRRD